MGDETPDSGDWSRLPTRHGKASVTAIDLDGDLWSCVSWGDPLSFVWLLAAAGSCWICWWSCVSWENPLSVVLVVVVLLLIVVDGLPLVVLPVLVPPPPALMGSPIAPVVFKLGFHTSACAQVFCALVFATFDPNDRAIVDVARELFVIPAHVECDMVSCLQF